MKNIILKFTIACIALLGITSCAKQLDRYPKNGVTDLNVVYKDLPAYKQVLAKVYASYALTGNTGNGSSDLQGIDAGYSDFLRMWWNLSELSTDEAVCGWNDPGIPDLHNMNWNASNIWARGLYYRSFFQIDMCNEFIRQSSDANLTARGLTGADATEIKYMQAESRFLRAFQYWLLMDVFGNPPFVTDADGVGAYLPKQIKRADLFNWIETELKAIDPLLKAPKTNEYGRADQAAAWALLARMYLNAKVYTGTARFTDAITYSSKVINAGYALKAKYPTLFMADNNVNNSEVILPIVYDGINEQTWGGMTFLVNASYNGDIGGTYMGLTSGGWGGNRSTRNLPQAFTDYSGSTDKRALFTASGASTKLDIDALGTFTDGLPVLKFRNIKSDGTKGDSFDGNNCSTDFPLFRLAEQYLIYAEAVLSGGTGGSTSQALTYINNLRDRAYGNTTNRLSSIALSDVINERQKELYWECFRRTDLIRYGYYTSSTYVWPWKGGVKTGIGVDSKFNLFPIPADDINVNTNLNQNTGF
jgi:starch-binding outer membrane protein, SusD/RagB family